MPLTSRESAQLASGEPHQVIRAITQNTPTTSTSIKVIIASGDHEAMAKYLAVSGVIRRAIAQDDAQNEPTLLTGLL